MDFAHFPMVPGSGAHDLGERRGGGIPFIEIGSILHRLDQERAAAPLEPCRTGEDSGQSSGSFTLKADLMSTTGDVKFVPKHDEQTVSWSGTTK